MQVEKWIKINRPGDARSAGICEKEDEGFLRLEEVLGKPCENLSFNTVLTVKSYLECFALKK